LWCVCSLSCPGALPRSYLDDTRLAGPLTTHVLPAFRRLEQLCVERGLRINHSKCVALVPEHMAVPDSLLPGVPVVRAGAKVLGAPVGSPEFQVTGVQGRASEIHRVAGLVGSLSRAQLVPSLLRVCVASRAVFILRCVPPSCLGAFTKAVDTW
jgi:hypothetical protein